MTDYLELERTPGRSAAASLQAADNPGDGGPAFSLQPLVENAIVHAIAPRVEGRPPGGLGPSRRGLLRLEVSDDGPGADEEAIHASPGRVATAARTAAALYGGAARLGSAAVPGGGLRVTLDLPDAAFGGSVNPRSLRAVVVEDEALAVASLREYLEEAPWIQVVGEAADGSEALRLIEAQARTSVFLDVRLPEVSGLEVARRVQHPCALVFTTAYDRFAIAAFELGAIDYLVKPFGRDRSRPRWPVCADRIGHGGNS